MLIALDHQEIRFGRAVDKGIEYKIEPSFCIPDRPRIKKIILIEAEDNLTQLVYVIVIDDGILTGWGAVGEAVAEIQAERNVLKQAGGTCPIPCVLVGPPASSPIENPQASPSRSCSVSMPLRMVPVALRQLIFSLR